ncbi:hypothetical protein OAZ22_00665 [Pelagibacteraceae bacterium]|nr:hypothetical protein [Pelagibacteraceae bacterium]
MDIETIIKDEIASLNHKIKGTSFLEILKFNLLERIASNSDETKDKELNNLKNNFKFEIEKNNLIISIFCQTKSAQQLNKLLDKNLLIISLSGTITIDIFINSDSKNKQKIVIGSKMGITLPRNTLVNINLHENSYILKVEQIEQIEDDSDIEKTKI